MQKEVREAFRVQFKYFVLRYAKLSLNISFCLCQRHNFNSLSQSSPKRESEMRAYLVKPSPR